jgi:CRISPR-associated endonuclease Csy4
MYYTDLTLIPSADFSDALLMSTLMQKLHPHFVKMRGAIGASFPEIAKNNLGTTMRLQSRDKDALIAIPEFDFATRSSVKEVPADATPIRVKRAQFKSSVARLARRYAARHGVSIDEAMKQYSDFEEQRTALPYITLNSASTGQQFRLFVTAEDVDAGIAGHFTSYGLSSEGSTVMRF